MKSKSIIENFIWVVYPVLVILLLVVSFNQLQGGGVSKLNQMLQKQDQAAEEEKKLTSLQQKLALLKGVDVAVESDNLAWTVRAMPAAKQVWVMQGELNNAASAAGVTIDRYTATVGDVTEATAEASAANLPVSLDVEYRISDFSQLQKVISGLENSLPLLSISKVSYTNGTGKLSITGAWRGWGKVSNEALSPLPDYKSSLVSLKAKLQDFMTLPEVSVDSSGSGVVNPF